MTATTPGTTPDVVTPRPAAAPPAGTAATGGPPPVRRLGAALTVVLVAAFMTGFDTTGVNIAVPSIQDGLGASYASMQWVLAGYTLPFALLLVTGGRIGDAFGRKRAFLVGLAGFTIASVLAGIAGDVGWLVAARVAQGITAAIMGPQILAVFQVLVPPARRAPLLAVYGLVIGLATVSGPMLGGVLMSADLFGWGWRTIFLINLPIGVAAFFGAVAWLPESRDERGGGFDLGGVFLAAAALLLLLHPLMYGRELGWPWWSWVCLVASVPAFVLLVRFERRKERAGESPLVALHLFGQRTFTAGVLANLIVSALMWGFFLTFVVFLQSGLGFTADRTGWTVASWAIGTALASMVAIPLARSAGRTALVVGAVLMTLGMAGLNAVVVASGAELTSLPIVVSLSVVGVGMGLVSAPMLNVTLAGIPHVDAGSASGIFSTFKQTGGVLGVAVTGAVFFGLLADQDTASRARFVDAMSWTLGLQVLLCLMVVALVFFLPRKVDAAAR
ncbi:drug resistance transporter, EmrB/QacA subfamily [Micromonospora pallida]|uniref:Drug resistance transporter, EmrB/QacA subfamily n=1 Tax=Micromonospora pallida TaxID=145854 RepID=A0A1C6SQ46_9ACTN|nr:MFS transporter [Micromonospora pallida]SCL31403.1 drug resistance transporter, EmrB/QacA subfamily [Micromonospora pallida]